MNETLRKEEKIPNLTETQEQSVHSHWINTEKYGGNQISSNHYDDNRNQVVVQSVRINLTFQVEVCDRTHTQRNQ